MKLDTFIIMSKGLAYILTGVFAPWTAALAQWANSDQWPSKIIWVGVILPASVIGGASQWLSFCSGSWKEYSDQRKANSTGVTKTTTTEPEPTKP